MTRILRSPVVSLSDKTLRYLASKSFHLVSAYNTWSTGLGLPPEDKERIKDLLDFKDDLRWDREGPKAALISKIIAHGRLDSVLLSSEEGVQAQANLWVLGEVVSKWEEEELMSYQDFVERLKALRERAYEGNEDDYSRAILADESTTSSVKIMTVHASKGLEFPVVFIPETIVTTNEFMQANERVARTREGGIILRPRGGTTLPSRSENRWTELAQANAVGFKGKRELRSLVESNQRPDHRELPSCKPSESEGEGPSC